MTERRNSDQSRAWPSPPLTPDHATTQGIMTGSNPSDLTTGQQTPGTGPSSRRQVTRRHTISSAKHPTTHREWNKHTNGHSARRRRRCLIAGLQPPSQTLPLIRAPGHDQHATLESGHIDSGSPKPPTRHALSQGTGQTTLHRHAHARPHPLCRHGRVHIGTPNPRPPAFEDTSTCKAAASVRLTCPRREWIGRPLHRPPLGGHQPSTLGDPHPNRPTLRTPQGHQPRPTRTIRRNANTSHATSPPPALSAETTSAPPCQTPHHPIALFGRGATTQQPGFVTPPL